jgi:phosphatidylcholine synthase
VLAVIAAWLVHLYTASGAVCALLAARAVVEHRYRGAFLWLAVALVVDATDGLLARRARVVERLPWVSGAKIDDLVDFLTFVFVPALMVWRAQLVPEPWAIAVPAAMILSSAYGFSRTDAKTKDHFFTGFPSYWNIVVFYLFVLRLSSPVNAVILAVLAALVFVPIRYVYPSRNPACRGLTVTLGAMWGGLVVLMIWQLPGVSRPLLWASLVFPAYYVLLSMWLNRNHPLNA